ncbi:uncharacterized protein LOC110068563 [Orbicella faveolata]|uniref:uncharacterized protein LOC110068563 n=1 Tax=Orbicella faveolata TaxID=48498 RepID=UPI0009E3DE66|nr:uncharacterized protein LOC110068563 [Orbicella faveolata]
MLQNCPKSCQVCLGVPACVNIYNDQYCQMQLGNCWRPATAADLVKNCRKTCVCKCCSSPPVPLPTTATLSKKTTARQTTTARQPTTACQTTAATIFYSTTTARQTTAATVLYSTSTEEGKTTTGTKEKTSIPQTTKRTNNVTRQDIDSSEAEASRLNVLMLSAIIAGVVAFICVVGVVLFCFWRRKRSGSLNQQKWPTLPQAPSDTIRSEEIIWLERQPRKDSRNPILGSVEAAAINGCNNQVITTDSRKISDVTDTISRPPDTPLYQVLEGPYGMGTIMDRALSGQNEQSSERFRSDSDYDEPVLKEERAAIGSPSKGRKKEAVYEDAHLKRFTDAAGSSDTLDNNDEYCYSYTTDLPLKDEKSRPHEDPKTNGPLYHSLEGPNAGYQALEGKPAPTNGYTPMEGVTELSGYQPLQKPTRSVYQPLRKTTTETPRRAFTRK